MTCHPIPGDSGRGGVVNVGGFKDDLAGGGHGDAVPIGKGQGTVVIQNRVEVFNPNSIHRAIQHQPHVLPCGRRDNKSLSQVQRDQGNCAN